MSNKGIISEWYDKGTHFNAFLKILKKGDLIEIERDGYYHWAVYVGEVDLEIEEGFTGVFPSIIHRANPPDDTNSHSLSYFLSSRSLSKGRYGVGNVQLEPLSDIWGQSRARINNSMDTTVSPFAPEEIITRVMNVIYGNDRQSSLSYNVMSNNCEHFAKWARNGWAMSQQVTEGLIGVAKFGVALCTALLPRPLALAAGVTLAGYEAINQQRRTGNR